MQHNAAASIKRSEERDIEVAKSKVLDASFPIVES